MNCHHNDNMASKLGLHCTQSRRWKTKRPPGDSHAHLSPFDAGACRQAPTGHCFARKGIRHLAGDQLGRPGHLGASPGLRIGGERPAARHACGGGGRQQTAPLRHHVGGAIAGGHCSASVPRRGCHGICVPVAKRRGRFRRGGRPRTGRQTLGVARPVPTAAAHLV